MDYIPIKTGRYVPLKPLTEAQVALGENCPGIEWYKYIEHPDSTIKRVARYIVDRLKLHRAIGASRRHPIGDHRGTFTMVHSNRLVEVSSQVYKVDMYSVTPQNVINFKILPEWAGATIYTIVLPEDRLKAAETYCNIVNDFCPSADRKELLRRIILEMDCPKNPLSPWLVKKHFKRGLADGTWDKPYKSLIEGLELRVQDYPKDTYKASAIISKFCPKEMKDKIAYCVVNSKDRLEAALDEIIASEAKRING